MLPWWIHSDFWQWTNQVVKHPGLPRWQAVPKQSSRLLYVDDFLTLTFDTQNKAIWNASTLPTDVPPLQHSAPSSSTPAGSYQLPQGKATPTTALLLPYSKLNRPLSCIPRHQPNTLCISPTSPMFLCQPSFCGVLLTMFQHCYGTFLFWGQCPTNQACWPLVFWCNALLPVCPVLSKVSGLSKQVAEHCIRTPVASKLDL